MHAIDVLVLAGLEHPSSASRLLRELRAGELHTRVHPAQPVVTIGPTDELTVLRAYEAGSDHHLAAGSSYLVLRAVVEAVARRTLEHVTSRHVRVGELHIDTAARSVDIDGARVKLTPKEYKLLLALAREPGRVFTRNELMRAVWGSVAPCSRTLDSHAVRLRQRLAAAGAGLVHNHWGTGYSLTASA